MNILRTSVRTSQSCISQNLIRYALLLILDFILLDFWYSILFYLSMHMTTDLKDKQGILQIFQCFRRSLSFSICFIFSFFCGFIDLLFLSLWNDAVQLFKFRSLWDGYHLIDISFLLVIWLSQGQPG